MAFMKRDVNLGLLVLIIASIVLFSGFSVYYQTTFKDVSLEYQTKLEQLGKVTNELAAQKQALNETYSLRVKAEQDKNTLDARYTEVRDENSNLQSDNSNLRSEVSSTKSQLAEKSAELGATKSLLTQTQSELSSVRSERDAYKTQSDTYKTKRDNLCDYLKTQGLSHGDC